MQAVTALIENDAGQILVLQDPANGLPFLPRVKLQATQGPLKVLRRWVNEEVGLEIAGWAELSVLTKDKDQFHGYRAYVSGGKPRNFPTKKILSYSWVDPQLAVRILEGVATRKFLQDRYPYLFYSEEDARYAQFS